MEYLNWITEAFINVQVYATYVMFTSKVKLISSFFPLCEWWNICNLTFWGASILARSRSRSSDTTKQQLLLIQKFSLCFSKAHRSPFAYHQYLMVQANLSSSVHLQQVPQLKQVVVLGMELSCISPAHSLSCAEAFWSPTHTHIHTLQCTTSVR